MQVLFSLVKFLLNPFNIFLLLMGCAFIAWVLKKNRFFKVLYLFTLVWLLFISTSYFPRALLYSLEYRHLPLSESEIFRFGSDTHIVVLGGGHGFNDDLPANSLLSTQALARLNEGVRLHRLIPGSKLVLSGYSASGRISQAEMLQAAALNIGVEAGSILLQKMASNTFEEAKMYFQTYGNNHQVILVTSAAHIPRAAMLFEKCGADISVSPAHYRVINTDRPFQMWPSIQYIDQMRIGFYEYAGIYRDSLRDC